MRPHFFPFTEPSVEVDVSCFNCTGGVTADGQRMASASSRIDEDAETVTFVFPRAIPQGMATLHINFHGILNKNLKGFYQSQYKAADGSTSRVFLQLSGYHGFAVVDFKTHKEVARIKVRELFR